MISSLLFEEGPGVMLTTGTGTDGVEDAVGTDAMGVKAAGLDALSAGDPDADVNGTG